MLPATYALIEAMAPDSALRLDFVGEQAYTLEPKDMHAGVLEARTAMYDDWVLRWISNIDPMVKRTYAISTLLHPCFKKYDFIDDFDLIPQSDKEWALRELRATNGLPSGSRAPSPSTHLRLTHLRLMCLLLVRLLLPPLRLMCWVPPRMPK